MDNKLISLFGRARFSLRSARINVQSNMFEGRDRALDAIDAVSALLDELEAQL